MIATLADQTLSKYQAIFHAEQAHVYPVVEAFEQRMGFAIDREKLEEAARVLACPLKKNPPNWQHGRVLYAAAAEYLTRQHAVVTLLDIGTAKGFSALCLQWALDHSSCIGQVFSVDVIDPLARVHRNSVVECDGPKTLAEILWPWVADADRINFRHTTGREFLESYQGRIHVAFVDGKHAYDAVKAEAELLASRQKPGDLVMFDDIQIPAVAQAVAELRAYDLEYLSILPNRKYAIGRRT